MADQKQMFLGGIPAKIVDINPGDTPETSYATVERTMGGNPVRERVAMSDLKTGEDLEQRKFERENAEYERKKNLADKYNIIAEKQGLPLKDIGQPPMAGPLLASAGPTLPQGTQVPAVQEMNIEGGTISPTPVAAIGQTAVEKSPFDIASGNQIAGAKGVAAAEQEGYNRQVGILSGVEKAQQEMAAKQAANQDLISKAQKDSDDFNLKQVDEMKKMKVQDYWADRSTGAKIAAAIAIGFGGYSAAMTGGPNQALNIINSAAESDAKRQVQNFELRKEGLAQEASGYARNLQFYKDKGLAMQATLAQNLEAAKIQLEKSAALTGSDAAKSKAQMMIGEIQNKQLEFKANIDAKLAERAGKMANLQVPGATDSRGNPLIAPDEKSAEALKDPDTGIVARKKLEQDLNTLAEKTKVVGPDFNPLWDDSDKAQVAAFAESIKAQMTKINYDAKNPERLKEAFKAMGLDDPLAIRGNKLKRIQTTATQQVALNDSFMNNYGLGTSSVARKALGTGGGEFKNRVSK